MKSWGIAGVMVLALAVPLGLPQATLIAQGVRPDPPRSSKVFDWHVLVPGPERFRLRQGASGSVLVTARNPLHLPVDAWNRRQVFTKRATAPSTNQTVCATWRYQSQPYVQQGLAVRVVGGPGNRQRAVTLTKNTFAGYFWVFNVLTWDTRRPGDPWRKVAQFNLSDVVVEDGQWVPLPWRVCLRVHARTVTFKVWLPDEEAEPAWEDPTHTRQASLPGRFVYPGRPGWYVGHLPVGESIEYADLTD